MTAVRPTRAELLIAAGCAGWAAAFLSPRWPWIALLAPLYAAATLPARRAPVLAGYAVACVDLVQWTLGVPAENPANTAAVVVTGFCLGRYAGVWSGAPPLVLLGVAMAARDGFAAPTVGFVAVVLTAIWILGFLVRRRAERATRATRAVADLAATDLAARAAGLVAEERSRLAGEVVGVVRAAVESMRRRAEAARDDLDPTALAEIQAEGRRAVTELRRLLGLLRSEPALLDAAQPRVQRRRPWRVDAVTAAVAGVIVVIEALTVASAASAGSVALTLALCASLAVRRTDPAMACLAALVATVLAIGLDAPLLAGFETPLVVLLLAWSVGVAGRLRGYAALAAWALAILLELRLHDPGNEAIVVVYVVGGAVAGWLWGVRRREERAALDAAADLSARHAAAAEHAVRAERLRLARELHDVTSHAIGVMVLQAAAAEAQRTRDPDAAGCSLAAVRAASEQALSELAALFGLLDAGAVGAPGLATAAAAADLADAVRALVDRLRTAGVDVSLTIQGDLTADEVPAATAHRVVQEALTNAMRHAPGSRVTVGLTVDRGQLSIEVHDDGPGPDRSGDGFGLVGLAERIRAEGGQIAAGPRPERGFAVSARLPLRPRRETSTEAAA